MNTNHEANLVNDLILLGKVVTYGNFSETSRSLGINASQISKRISRLEHQLGIKLFERNTRNIQLTDEGLVIYQQCQQMIQLLESVKNTAEQFSSQVIGELIVSAPKAFANAILSPLISKYLALYPRVNLQLKVTDDRLDLIRGNIDCSFIATENPPQDHIARPLMKIEQVVCASQNYLAQYGHPKTPGDLINHVGICLGENPNDNIWKFRDQKGNLETVSVSTKFATNHSKIRLQAIIDGIGIGHMPYFVAKQALQSGQVIRILEDWELISNYQGTAWLIYLPNKFATPKVKSFVDFIIKELVTSG